MLPPAQVSALRPELLLVPRTQAHVRVGSTKMSVVLECKRACFPVAARANALFFTVSIKNAAAQDANQAPGVRVGSLCKCVLMPEGAADQEAFFQAVARGQFWHRTGGLEGGRIPSEAAAREARRRLLDLASDNVAYMAPQLEV